MASVILGWLQNIFAVGPTVTPLSLNSECKCDAVNKTAEVKAKADFMTIHGRGGQGEVPNPAALAGGNRAQIPA